MQAKKELERGMPSMTDSEYAAIVAAVEQLQSQLDEILFPGALGVSLVPSAVIQSEDKALPYSFSLGVGQEH